MSFDETGEIVGEHDVVVQTRRALERLEGVLKAAGARGWTTSLSTTVYLTDADHAPAFNEEWSRWFRDRRPARATPAILLDRYGDQGYATIAGILGTPTTISRATAPLAAAALATTIGYQPLVLAAGAACVTAGAALTLTRRLPADVG